ncbi:hypothetical protein [Nocardioides deserti]|uniref:DUF4439 domain-containing protein n=1 Tax=Nocardioides deserti TaxID=1588644 RepID=A0ABR6UCF7_9ACTN|nr:hypothetical protein [Nocardioides deserti]MBC2962137.1 hypothetical protein [Nocardioides deserti]GGO70043.1 hypothetical protein GCM10012276_07680 [Nocardioides deserti]
MPPLPPASRRAVVGVGTVTLVPVLAGSLGACDASDVGDLLPGADPSGGSSPAPAPDPDADEALVDEAVGGLAEALALVAAVRVRHPRLRDALAGLEDTHAAHLAALEGEQRGPAAPPTADAAAALALVRRRATATQRRLADQAVRADSGQLAQLLASMAAAVAQQLVLLPRRPGASA